MKFIIQRKYVKYTSFDACNSLTSTTPSSLAANCASLSANGVPMGIGIHCDMHDDANTKSRTPLINIGFIVAPALPTDFVYTFQFIKLQNYLRRRFKMIDKDTSNMHFCVFKAKTHDTVPHTEAVLLCTKHYNIPLTK